MNLVEIMTHRGPPQVILQSGVWGAYRVVCVSCADTLTVDDLKRKKRGIAGRRDETRQFGAKPASSRQKESRVFTPEHVSSSSRYSSYLLVVRIMDRGECSMQQARLCMHGTTTTMFHRNWLACCAPQKTHAERQPRSIIARQPPPQY